MNSRNELKTVIANHVKIKTGKVPPDSELNNYADNLVSFFEILIEEDRKSNEDQNLRNTDISG